MIGAIAGDVIGSVHEGAPPQQKGFALLVRGSRFTDDTVCTVAIASAVTRGEDFADSLRRWCRRYPNAGYGRWFAQWITQDAAPAYNSYGNGSAMRVAPIAWAHDDLETVLREAARSAAVTHDHPEGIKGAEAVAAAVLLARTGHGKDRIAALMADRFGYDCDLTLQQLRARGGCDVSCQQTVPAAAVAFLESTGFEDAIRNAVSIGGDTDTVACVTGAMAEAHYGEVPDELQAQVLSRLDTALAGEVAAFARRYLAPRGGAGSGGVAAADAAARP